MTIGSRVTAWSFAALMAGVPAYAQDDTQGDPPPPSAVQITPFVSLGSTASSRVGATIRFAWTSKLSLEAEMGYRRGEIGALGAHLSLLYDLPRRGRVVPYLAGGLGLEEYGTATHIPQFGVVTQEQLGLAVNAGGGLYVPVTERWGLRTDVRWFNGLSRSGPEHWRVFNGVTFRPGSR